MLLWYSLFLLAPDLVQVEGCDSGWTQNRATGSCYKILYPDIMTWDVAKSRCAGLGAELVSIRSNQENEFVKGLVMPLVQSNQVNGFWIGGQKSGSGWKWTDGSQVKNFYWLSSQPNNLGGNQNCLEMWWRNGKLGWADQMCGIAPWTAICKKPASANCRCGLAKRQSGGRIVGGQTTEVNEYPWMVMIYGNKKYPNSCGGSLISDQWILTAAHCVDGDDESVVLSRKIILGEHDIFDDTETNKLSIGIERVVLHPKYKKIECGAASFDFALLKLKTPINFDAYPNIRPICLPDSYSLYDGYNAIATGWGWRYNEEISYERGSPQLQEVELKVLSNTECKASGYKERCYKDKTIWPIRDEMICAGDGYKDACKGDSGGPLITSKFGNGVSPGQNYEIIGVTSFGRTGSCNPSPGFPGVYARVTKALEWIITTIYGTKICPRF